MINITNEYTKIKPFLSTLAENLYTSAPCTSVY